MSVCYNLLNSYTATPATKESLRNLGTFMGLITIARDKHISADLIDFRPLLEHAFQSNNDARLTLAVVLVTHVFKHCQRSVIFKKNCTWVSRIINTLKDIHSEKTNKLHIILEIERFLETLEDSFDEEESEQDIYYQTSEISEYKNIGSEYGLSEMVPYSQQQMFDEYIQPPQQPIYYQPNHMQMPYYHQPMQSNAVSFFSQVPQQSDYNRPAVQESKLNLLLL